jgi:hypothetical protein
MTGPLPIDWQLGTPRSPRSEFDAVDGPTDSPSARLHEIYATDPTDLLAEVDTDEVVPGFREG